MEAAGQAEAVAAEARGRGTPVTFSQSLPTLSCASPRAVSRPAPQASLSAPGPPTSTSFPAPPTSESLPASP